MRNWTTPGNGANYSIVDMALSAGSGSVTTKNVLLNANARESLTATKHCNNIDYWITFWDRSTNSFNTYLLTSSGLSASPIVSTVGTFSTGTSFNRYGYLRFSQNGKKLAYSLGGQGLQGTQTTVEVYDFNNTTGIISNPQTLALANTLPDAYSCEFSPSAGLLYVVAFNGTFINQYNLQAGTTAQIISSQTNVSNASPGVKSCLQMAPDGKLYVALSSQSFVGVINNPNTPGNGCNYVHNAVSLGAGRTCGLGLPNFMQRFYAPPVNLGHDTTVCHSLTLSASSGWNSYLWNTGATTQSISVNATGNYWVHVDNGVTCGLLGDTIHVTIATPLSGTTHVTNIRCYGEANGSATVTITGGTAPYGYLWNNSQATQSASNLSVGIYSVDVTDAHGCKNTQTISVTQPSTITLATAGTTNTHCHTPNGTASVLATGGTPGYSYLWSNGQTSPSATGLSAGIYSVGVTDTRGCINTQTIGITQSATISITATGTTNTSCRTPNGTASVIVTAGTPGYSYVWSNGQTSPSATGLSGGNHTVTVSDANGCTASQIVTVTETTSIPIVNLSASPGLVIAGDQSQLIASGGGTYNWFMSPELSCNNCPNPIASPLKKTSYCVEVTNSDGCKAKECITIEVESAVYIPNAFTPNEDALNDLFKPIIENVHDYKLSIFDRWGEQLFETSNTEEGWNGSYKQKPCKSDVYVYKIVYTDDFKKTQHERIGKVTLVK